MMKRSEAARYARWSAAIAIAITVLATGVYLRRQFAERGARRAAPPPVPANVEQQSSQFSYSKVIGNRTLFTVHASQATEYKDQNHTALQEVLITIYGRNGDRNDTIAAHQCSYMPVTGRIQCLGEVQIDLKNAPANGSAAARGLHLETQDISFDPASEKVSTPNDISLEVSDGRGRATGVNYDTKNEVVKFESNVRWQFGRSGGRLATPVSLSGSSLEYRRSTGLMQLSGPVTAQEGGVKIRTGALEVQLDSQMIPMRFAASQGVKITDAPARGPVSFEARNMQVILGLENAIQRIIADGNVHAEQKTKAGEELFSAEHAELTTFNRNGRNEPHELQASGNIQAETREAGVTRHLATTSLHVEFAPMENGSSARILDADTQTPGEITVIQPGETDRIRAGKFSAEFNPKGQLVKLTGAEGVDTSRQIGTQSAQVTSAQNLTAIFSGAKDWAAIDETGSVKFQLGDQTGMADRVELTRATNEIVLDGNATIRNSASSTSAAHIEMNQATREIHATGSVVSTYFGAPGARPVSLGAGAAHISADRLDASNSTGSETYSGHARLWQNDAALNSDTIEIWRAQKKLQARGDACALIPEVSKDTRKNKTPVLWQVRAPRLEYWSDAGRIDLTGGVQAQSAIGTLSGEAVEVVIAPDSRNQQRLQRAAADGNVRIQANGRFGTAKHGEYTSGDGKFVLSGGQPTLSDALGNTTTGHELTFFLANDTILVDSQKDLRTVTKHRVEK
ncbi:MAG TPA: LPS export ABC transporter periplasmic protein LptC [Candidatus Acidoferrales bacterium]|nr:LPS export ABC transporter periplasmic protein LptC [Candidatus Acidoferrales bacterium]